VLIQVISSTTREGRFSERTARWVVQSLRAREDFEFGRWKDAGRTDGIAFEHMRLLQALKWSGGGSC
jgi:hypothetical protein